MERFCPHCGKAADNHTHYCDGCGGPIDITPPQPRYTTLAGMPPPPYFPPAGSEPTTFDPFSPIPPRQFKTKIRGRGFGITSMVLGIIGMVYALVLALAAFTSIRQWQTQAFMGDSVPFYFPNPAKELLGSAVSISLMPLLALVFALISKHLGYRCKVSSAGLIMGSIGIAICTIASLYLIQFL